MKIEERLGIIETEIRWIKKQQWVIYSGLLINLLAIVLLQ